MTYEAGEKDYKLVISKHLLTGLSQFKKNDVK